MDERFDKEYFSLFETVNEFDKRLLTIKGWGVTLSLAALGFGFQYAHAGLFLVASLSGLGFWMLEAELKKHQMRYYVRMREIEVLRFQEMTPNDPRGSSPQIDWSWSMAPRYFYGVGTPEAPRFYAKFPYDNVWFWPHVCLPHLISAIAGAALLILGLTGKLGAPMSW